MVQKRPFEDEEAHEFFSKLPRQDPCDRLSLFSEISPFGDANQISSLSDEVNLIERQLPVFLVPYRGTVLSVVVDGGFTKGKLVNDKELPSIEKEIKRSPGREVDPYSTFPGGHSFSSGGTSSTSEEDVWMEAHFNTCFFPEFFYPERPARTVTRREEIYSLLLEYPPQKRVPIGPLHQADIPALTGVDSDLHSATPPAAAEDAIRDEDEEPLAGTSIIPMPSAALRDDDAIKLGRGRTDCSCQDKGSIRCVQQHVVEARDKLKIFLGLKVFEDLGFSDIEEQVSEKWNEEEENLFHEVVFSNPSSMGRNFWNCLSHVFPSRTKAEIVSYYFNVFMLRKRAEQNRLDPMNIDSDNDEWEANEEEDEDSVVETPVYQLHPSDRSGDHSNECLNENVTDDTSDDNEGTSAHIGTVDDSLANVNFQPVGKTWDERSYHGAQDDSCTSFDTGATMLPMQLKYDSGVCDGNVQDRAHITCLKSEDDFMPTFSVIEEVCGDKLSNCQNSGKKDPTPC